MDVAGVEGMRAQALVHMVQDVHVRRVPQVGDVQELFRVGHAGVGQGDVPGLLVDDVVAGLFEFLAFLRLLVARDARARDEFGDDLVDLVVEVGGFLRGAADDEGRAGLVDQDRVDFVDDRVVVTALNIRLQLELHVVAQIVEAELVVGAVGDVGGVGLLPVTVHHVVLDAGDGEAERLVQAPHPVGVALGEVVVYGDDVNPFAGQGVQTGGKSGHEGLTLAGPHLGDGAFVEGHAADELHIEMPHVEDAPAALPADREGLGKEIVESGAPGEPVLELAGLRPEVLV